MNEYFNVPDSINVYMCNKTSVNILNTWYTQSTIFQDPTFIVYEKTDIILGIRKLPLKLALTGAQLSNLESGPFEIKWGDENATGYKINNSLVAMPTRTTYINNLLISRKYNNFLDFDPYTKIQLYLPLIGLVNLDTNSVMGKEISVVYLFDYLGNQVGAEISVKDGNIQRIIETQTGALGMNIPYTYVNSEEMSRNLAIGAIKAASYIGSGVVGSSFSSSSTRTGENEISRSGYETGLISSNTKRGYSTPKLNNSLNQTTKNKTIENRTGKRGREFDFFNAGSSIAATLASSTLRGNTNIQGTNLNYYQPFEAYLIRSTVSNEYPNGFAKYFGYPLKKTRQVAEMSGFTVFGEIHVDDVDGATFDEKDIIEDYLKKGVIL